MVTSEVMAISRFAAWIRPEQGFAPANRCLVLPDQPRHPDCICYFRSDRAGIVKIVEEGCLRKVLADNPVKGL